MNRRRKFLRFLREVAAWHSLTGSRGSALAVDLIDAMLKARPRPVPTGVIVLADRRARMRR